MKSIPETAGKVKKAHPKSIFECYSSEGVQYCVFPVEYKAVKHCLYDHYLGPVPNAILAFSDPLGALAVYNNLRSRHLEKNMRARGIKPIELVRLWAPSEYPHGYLSRFVAATLRYIQKTTDYDLVVSYADGNAGHRGTIYRACNFIYMGETEPDYVYYIDGVRIAPHGVVNRYGTRSIPKLKQLLGSRLRIEKEKASKSRFFYPLNQKAKEFIKEVIACAGSY